MSADCSSHFWQIPPASEASAAAGETEARCRHCGATRMLKNSLELIEQTQSQMSPNPKRMARVSLDNLAAMRAGQRARAKTTVAPIHNRVGL